MKRFKLFGIAFEYLDFLLSMAFLLLSLYESLYLPVPYLTGRQWTLLQDIFFLKNGHVVFTFLFMFNTRQGHDWLRHSPHPGFLLRCVFVFAGSTFGGLVLALFPYSTAAELSRFIFIYAGKHHQLQQCRGIQKLFELKFPDCISAVSHTQKRMFSIDALIWYGLSASSSCALYIAQLKYRRGEFPNLVMFSHVSLAACLVFLILLFIRTVLCYKNGLGLRINMRNLRFIPFLLVNHSEIAKFASATLHGVESFGIMNHLDSHSDSILSRKFVPFLLAGGMFAIIFLHYPNLIFPNTFSFNSMSMWGLLPSLVAGLSFLHFFIDSQLFSGETARSRRFVLSKLSK